MMSKLRMAVAASIIGIGTLAGAASSAIAAPVTSATVAAVSKQAQSTPLAAEKVHYRSDRRKCAHRWGRHTRGYHRCLHRQRHVRPVRNYCKATRHECADRWGWRTWRYNRCVRNRGC